MLMKKSVGLAILMVFLLLYPRFAAEGARYGLLLWYTSVVPSLFPFMVLSSLIVSSGGVSLLMKPVRAFLGPWLPLSENGCYTLISGLLCGCPMGAKTCGDFVREGKLSVQEGRFLMALDTAILAAAEILCRIGGYLMLFSIVIVFLRRALWLPASLRIFLMGAMEMTTGVREVSASLPFPDSGTAAAAILAFGGICSIFQTRAVTASGWPEEKKRRTDDSGSSPKDREDRTEDKKIAGLSIRQYILWKLLHSALAAVIFRLLGVLG